MNTMNYSELKAVRERYTLAEKLIGPNFQWGKDTQFLLALLDERLVALGGSKHLPDYKDYPYHEMDTMQSPERKDG